jgi:addiction module HigA family antidote
MPPAVHPGRLLKRELTARALSANRLALDIGVPSGRITDILNGRRSITADTAVRLGHYFGNSAQFWLDLQGQFDIAVVEKERGREIVQSVRHAGGRNYDVGLDSRHRDRDGEIRHKRSDTLVGTLRETYGPDFAKGYRSDARLGSVLKKERAGTLSSLIKGSKRG